MSVITTHRFNDANDNTERTVTVENEGRGISIHIPGYGTNDMEPGAGPVIYLELENGVPILRVWADITDEEPTHKISLAKASEKHRKD